MEGISPQYLYFPRLDRSPSFQKEFPFVRKRLRKIRVFSSYKGKREFFCIFPQFSNSPIAVESAGARSSKELIFSDQLALP
jgi:hypothetical protein